MKGYTLLVTPYAGDIVCDATFLNPVPNTNYWLTSMNKGDGDIIVRLEQALLPNVTMTKINKKHKFPKWCNKNQAEKLRTLSIRNHYIDEILEEIFRRDKLYTEFGIENSIDYSNDTNEQSLNILDLVSPNVQVTFYVLLVILTFVF